MHRGSRLDPWMLYRNPVRFETDAFERVCFKQKADNYAFAIELCMDDH